MICHDEERNTKYIFHLLKGLYIRLFFLPAGMKNRHVGDLGNIQTNGKGEAKYTFYDNFIKLRGSKSNIVGRGLIIHEDEDDCGHGNNAESLKTGNAGKRIACAVIGYSKENFKC